MTDPLKRLAQVSNQAAQTAANDLEQMAKKQEEGLKNKESLREIQNKLDPLRGGDAGTKPPPWASAQRKMVLKSASPIPSGRSRLLPVPGHRLPHWAR